MYIYIYTPPFIPSKSPMEQTKKAVHIFESTTSSKTLASLASSDPSGVVASVGTPEMDSV
jgi:hypothetical protein